MVVGAGGVSFFLRREAALLAAWITTNREKATIKKLMTELIKEPMPMGTSPIWIATLEKDMRAAARDLEFERAAEIRDRIRALRERLVALPE